METTKTCELCEPEEQKAATHFCIDCDEFYCDPCHVGHQRAKFSKGHPQIPAAEEIERSQRQPQDELVCGWCKRYPATSFCRNCAQEYCRTCCIFHLKMACTHHTAVPFKKAPECGEVIAWRKQDYLKPFFQVAARSSDKKLRMLAQDCAFAVSQLFSLPSFYDAWNILEIPREKWKDHADMFYQCRFWVYFALARPGLELPQFSAISCHFGSQMRIFSQNQGRVIMKSFPMIEPAFEASTSFQVSLCTVPDLQIEEKILPFEFRLEGDSDDRWSPGLLIPRTTLQAANMKRKHQDGDGSSDGDQADPGEGSQRKRHDGKGEQKEGNADGAQREASGSGSTQGENVND